jgi:H+/gluconate symporter-like permease
MTPLGLLAVALLIVIGGVLALRLHPFVVLITAAFAVALLAPREPGVDVSAGEIVAQGFGKTALDVGIVIALASILGACLAAAGGATRIVESIQRLVGERHTPLAMLLAGFILGIPMFAETVFYLLLPLARAAWERTGRGYLLAVLAIVAGATMTHSLVPPTPGPLFVADALGVPMATMIGVGLVVGFVAALAGYAYACWADRRWPLDPLAGAPQAGDAASGEVAVPSLPPLWAAILPILCSVAYAGSMIMARVMGTRDTAAAMAFWGNLAFLACAAALALIFGWGGSGEGVHPSLAFLTRGWVWPTPWDTFLMMSCGFFAAVGLTLLTQAYRVAQSSVVAPFEFTFAFWGILWGWLFWGDLPDALGWAGIGVIIAAGIYVLRGEGVSPTKP